MVQRPKYQRQPEPPAPLLLNTEETARLLGISPRFVLDLVRRGTLPHLRLGRRAVRIPRAAVEALAASARR